MKSFLFLTALLALGAAPARADPIQATVEHVHMWLVPTFSTGDNFGFAFTGPGLDIEGWGEMACSAWCDGNRIQPGTSIQTADIGIGGFRRALLGGIDYNTDSEIGFPFYGGFPFSDRGGLNRTALAAVGGPEPHPYRGVLLLLPTNGRWTLNFSETTDFEGTGPAFDGGDFYASATPEPAPVGLMLIGAAGIWITSRRRPARVV